VTKQTTAAGLPCTKVILQSILTDYGNIDDIDDNDDNDDTTIYSH
jgi:hypothetical protein